MRVPTCPATLLAPLIDANLLKGVSVFNVATHEVPTTGSPGSYIVANPATSDPIAFVDAPATSDIALSAVQASIGAANDLFPSFSRTTSSYRGEISV